MGVPLKFVLPVTAGVGFAAGWASRSALTLGRQLAVLGSLTLAGAAGAFVLKTKGKGNTEL